MKTLKKLTILKKLIEDKIDDHFENHGIYDYLKDNKTEFEISFEFSQGIKYNAIVPYNILSKGIYKKDQISVTDEKGFDYSIDDGNLIIDNRNYNPNYKTIDQRIDDTIEHEKRKLEENERYSRDINLTNKTLNEKYR